MDIGLGLLVRSMSEVVHSVNIMIAILLVGVCVTIYWIFKYDDWNPNPSVNSHVSTERESPHSGDEKLEVRTREDTSRRDAK